jgi:hypothetical protein
MNAPPVQNHIRLIQKSTILPLTNRIAKEETREGAEAEEHSEEDKAIALLEISEAHTKVEVVAEQDPILEILGNAETTTRQATELRKIQLYVTGVALKVIQRKTAMPLNI